MRRALLLPVLFLAVGCKTPAPELVAQADLLMRQKEYVAAADLYNEVLTRGDVNDLDRRKAAIGEAQSYLYRGDLTGAETRLRRLADNVSAKWYHLAEVALGRGQRDEALKSFQRALDLVHGGDTARRLAGLIAGEARQPLTLVRAADVFKRGGATEEAARLRALAEVWRGLEAGVDLRQLLTRYQGASSGAAATYPSVRILGARLFARAGRGDDARWKLDDASPAFRRWAAELRAQEAVERGDRAELSRLLRSIDAVTAARIRADLGRTLRFRGDLRGALAQYRDAAAGEGAATPEQATASAEAALLHERLGDLQAASDAWKVALRAKVEPTPRLRMLLARHLTAHGDLLGGVIRLGPSRGWPARERARARRLSEAARRLKAGLAAYVDGDRATTQASARAARTLVPGEPAAAGLLAGGKLAAAAGVSGETRLALARALLTRRLRTGDLERASALLERVSPKQLRRTLAAELYGGALAALRAGRDEQLQAFLRRHQEHLDLEPLRAATALRAYPEQLLPAPRGVLTVGKERRWGSLWAPRSGFRWPLVGLRRTPTGAEVQLPTGGTLRLADLEALAAQLGGGAARRLGWSPVLDPEQVEDRARQAQAGGAARLEPLEVE